MPLSLNPARWSSKGRRALYALLSVVAVAAVVAVSYTAGMKYEASRFDSSDAQVRSVIEDYVQAMNSNDLNKIKSLSIGLAADQLGAGFEGGTQGVYSQNIMQRIPINGPINIAKLNIISRGEFAYLVEVYTKYADQETRTYYYPAANVRFSMFNLHGQWKVMGIDEYMDYNIVKDK